MAFSFLSLSATSKQWMWVNYLLWVDYVKNQQNPETSSGKADDKIGQPQGFLHCVNLSLKGFFLKDSNTISIPATSKRSVYWNLMLLSNYIFSGISPLTTIKRKNEIDLRWLMFLSVTAKYYICSEIREEGPRPQVCHPPRIRVNIHVLMTTLPVPTWAHLTGPPFHLHFDLFTFWQSHTSGYLHC